MSKKNRQKQYNEQVKIYEEGKKIKVSPKLMEEFGTTKTTGKGKDKETHVVENVDEILE